MRIWTRKYAAYKTRGRLGPLAYSVLPLSAQQTVDAENILAMLNKHVNPDGTVDTVFVEFENEQLPVSSEAELPILSKMAALYHNALIAEACKRELDLYNRIPDFDTIDDSQNINNQRLLSFDNTNDDTSNAVHSTSNNVYSNSATHQECLHDQNDINVTMADYSEASELTPRSWDEEELGEQRVFDATWEMNEDLLPWNLNDVETEERFGSYI